jgi:hypothetical protein
MQRPLDVLAEQHFFCFASQCILAFSQVLFIVGGAGLGPVPAQPLALQKQRRSELLSFPAGKYDDQVDALGLIGQLLDQMVPGQAPNQPGPPKIDTGYRTYSFARIDDWVAF